DGIGLKRRLDLPEEAEVIWTRDGAKALVLAYPSDEKYVFMPATGAQRTIRLPGLASDNVPSWSPDDKRLAFVTVHGDVVALNVASGVRHRIAEGSNGFAVAWSPDGKRLLFIGDSNDLLYTAPPPVGSSSVAWSADGQPIVYTRNALGRGDFHNQVSTVKVDSSDQRPVTQGFPDDGSDDPDVWVAGTVTGKPAPRLPLVGLRGTRTIATSRPIVALAASGKRAAAAEGLGRPRD